MSSLPLGNSTDITGFSPADFGDAEDTRPFAIQMDPTGMGSLTPYSTLVQNVFQRHTVEIREKTGNPSPLPSTWKRRIREFMALKNEDLVQFLKKPLGSTSSVARADLFLQKFGRPDFQATHPSLQTTFLDVSGSSSMPLLAAELQQIGPSSPKQLLDQIQWLYDAYRITGDECLKHESQLKLRLDLFDKAYQKLIGLCELPANEDSEKVAEAVEVYVKRLLEEHRIEECYTETVETYRRFAALREMIHVFRFTDLQEKEPLCSICLTDSVSFTLSPCGHTFCATCIKKQSHACFMCRTTIRDKLKIYFG
jgi:hypothetical protein